MDWSHRIGLLTTFALLFIVSAAPHEVYVLPSDMVENSTATASPNPFDAVSGNDPVFAAFLIALLGLIIGTLYISTHEEVLSGHANQLKRLSGYGPYLAQATLGLGLIASAMTGTIFGPELPLEMISENIPGLSLILYMSGLLLLFNIETRITGLFSILLFAVAYQRVDGYMLHYAAYLGLGLFVVLHNKHPALDEFLGTYLRAPLRPADFISHPDKPFLLLRILYGTGILYSAIYAKYLHSNLALATIDHHLLTQYLPFEPLFIVLCAFLIEFLVGIMFIIGFEVRLATVMLLGFNIASFLVFNEALWPHIWLLGGAATIFIHGYDKYTVRGWLEKKHGLIPLL